jgi:hypothetical protein
MTTAYHCGNYIEIYTNKISQPKTPPAKAVSGINKNNDELKNLYISQAYHRARQNVKRLLFTNLTGEHKQDIFFTLTYADNMQDYQQSQKDFNRFRSRCRKAGFDFPYLIVSERQKRGAIHHHGVFFNTGRVNIPFLTKLWSHGYIFLEYVKYEKNPTALSHYLTKYITKAQDKTLHSKYYRTSYDLQRPVRYTANTYINRFYLPGELLHRSEYVPLYSDPVEYSLLQVRRGEAEDILEALRLAPAT